MHLKKSIILAALAAIISGPAGAIDIVFDPTNWIQNWTTAYTSVAVEARQASQYALQYQQYVVQARQLQAAASGAFKSQFAAEIEAYQTYKKYQGELERLQGDIGTVKAAWENRRRIMAASGLSWDQWLKREYDSMKYSRDAVGILSMHERQAMENVKARYSKIQEMQDKIQTSSGVHESTQQLNAQMSMLNATMQDMLAMNAAQGVHRGDLEREQINKDERATAAAAELEALRRQRRQADLDLIDSLAKQPDPLKGGK